jgi:hypothetical protein
VSQLEVIFNVFLCPLPFDLSSCYVVVLVFGFWFLVFGFWFLVFSFWFLVFGFWRLMMAGGADRYIFL